MSTCRLAVRSVAALAGQHDWHGIRNFGRDQTTVAHRSLYPGEGVQERPCNRGIDRSEGQAERANHPHRNTDANKHRHTFATAGDRAVSRSAS